MASANDFEVGKVYNFETYATSILGNFRGVRIEGIVGHKSAFQYNDVAALHNTIYPLLPANTTEDDFRKYRYLIVAMPNEELTIIGIPWIDAATIELVESQRVHVVIEDAGADNIEQIKRVLQANMLTVSSIRVEDL